MIGISDKIPSGNSHFKYQSLNKKMKNFKLDIRNKKIRKFNLQRKTRIYFSFGSAGIS